jgi:hypothetical protein
MKQFQNSFLLLLLTFHAYSQVEKSAVLVGLHNSLILNKNNSISFALSPQIGYFLKKKMLLGVSIPPSNSGKSLSGIFVPSDGYLKNRGLVSPFVRFYLFDDAKWQFYVQQSADFYRFKSNIAEVLKYSGKMVLGTTFNLGLIYFIDTATTLEFCYSRPLVAGTINLLPLAKTPYLKFGLNYMWKRKLKK